MATAQGSQQAFFGFIPKSILKYQDAAFAMGVVLVIAMLIIPMPAMLLDVLLIADMAISLLVLITVTGIRNVTEFNVFPSLLLVMTAFRLALNVSSTRLILTQGTSFSSNIIRGFADFVVGGNIVVGLIIFIILIIVQFVVVTKGAKRIAEVKARFTLDAMNIKFMAIDNELNAGALSEKEAQDKKLKLNEESNFFGSMDGASNFVQGDVIAGVVITVVNVLGGLIIGMVMRGESLEAASDAYIRFTIGDGLVSQIPAFLISFATGFLIVRNDDERSVSELLSKQVFTSPTNLFIVAGFVLLLGLVPGFPTILMIGFAAVAFAVGWLIREQMQEETATQQHEDEQEEEQKGPEDVSKLINVEKVELSIGGNLINLVDSSSDGDLLHRVKNTRRELALEMGMIVPPVRITDNMNIDPEEYTISINGTEMAKGSVRANMLLALTQADSAEELEGEKTIEPAFGLPAFWIPYDDRDLAERKGYMVFSPTAVVATHLTEVIKRNASDLLGREEVNKMLDNLKETHPTLVNEAASKDGALGFIQKVLQNLLSEGISIRNMIAILETIADTIGSMPPDTTAEFIRRKLAHQISKQHAADDGVIRVINLSQQIETTLVNSITDTGDGRGQVFDINPKSLIAFKDKLKNAVDAVRAQGMDTVILCAPETRRALQRFVHNNVGPVSVISKGEIAPGYSIESLVRVE